ncbi:hypothetical protein MKEN_01270400 [Mycena kentingensis (nom. inval.)]|nr:hypothetical protein MKEN_01270400 [Mycena kentingensis (nom. inval.)]
MSVCATSKRLRLAPAVCRRTYAISVAPPKPIKGMPTGPRTFSGSKAFQFAWYTRLIEDSTTSPLLILWHHDFKAQGLVKLRSNIADASARLREKAKPKEVVEPVDGDAPPPPPPPAEPHLTFIRSGIFGAALRAHPRINNAQVEEMVREVKGSLAVLSLGSLDPPEIKAILRTFERTVPPRKPKTPDELKKIEEEKKADPANPGRRMKRARQVVDPELRVLGAVYGGQVMLASRVKEVSEMPPLQTLREQIVGLLSGPGAQLAATLSEASGGKLARTLEGLKKALEEDAPAVDNDEDDFLYGGSSETPQIAQPLATPSSALSGLDTPQGPGIIAELKAEAEAAEASGSHPGLAMNVDEGGEEEEDYESSDDEADVEIVTEPQARSLDFRQANARAGLRTTASTASLKPSPSLTTEYTPIQRGGPPASAGPSTPAKTTTETPVVAPTPTLPPPQTQQPTLPDATADGVDPTTLPPVAAPPSHPAIDPTAMGTMEGRAIIEVDMSAMSDKAWRRPGSDISDWFNYGFDELSWEAYCYRRRDLGELANVLKTNVLNFSGLTEDQLTALPPDARTMVMTGTQAMMNNAMNGVVPGGPGMMGMMDMGMGMMGGPGMGVQDGSGGAGGAQAEQDGSGFGGPGAGMMGMGMDSYQDQGGQQQMYMDGGGGGGTGNAPTGPGMGRGAAPYRGNARGIRGVRGGGFVGRGRGRGGYDNASGAPARPISPLPANVPTGPRNQNKYKDRDGNAAAVDGLDYGGGKDARTSSGEPEDRGRKRRSSPSLDDRRESKRR